MNRPYKYKHLEHLKNADIANASIQSCNIFAYNVNSNCMIPFLKYLFVRGSDEQEQVLHLPSIEISLDLVNCEEIRLLCAETLLDILDGSSIDDFIYNGFETCGDTVNVFFDIGNYVTNISKFNMHNQNVKYCLIDEIVNTRSCFDLVISETVSLYFQINPSLVFLTDDNGRNYETPIAGYVYSPTNHLDFDYTFGIRKSDSLSLLGPYYYFTNYFNAKQNALQSLENGGVIRFALLMSSMLVKLNYPSDPIDVSDIKMDRLEDDTLERKYECLTMRVSDHSGKWAETHDSVFVGRVELDDGSFLRHAPFMVVKKYEQFVTLDYEKN
jgi:hypothetical protein